MQFGTCRHFTGISNDMCRAGLKYKDVRSQSGSLCCLAGQPSACQKYEEPTPEEIDAYEAETAAMIEASMAMFKTLKPILLHVKTKYHGKDMRGRMNCPVCKGQKTLHITHAKYNGHCLVFCETESCVRFME